MSQLRNTGNTTPTIDFSTFPRPELFVGRDESCDLVLPVQSGASRRHARIFASDGGWWIEDLQSSNGTEVNSVVIQEPRRLAEGDVIGIGTEIFLFEPSPQSVMPQADPVASAPPPEPLMDSAETRPAPLVKKAKGVAPPMARPPAPFKKPAAASASADAGTAPESAIPEVPEAREAPEANVPPAPLPAPAIQTEAPAPPAPVQALPPSAGLPPELQTAEVQEMVARMSQLTSVIRDEIGKAIVGQVDIVMDMLTAIISRGHVLLIGMPGLAKTTLVRTISEVLDLEFRRIQFTPDLMPSDITGTDILEVDEETGKKEYRFIKGPIFTQILLADEINRTPPKTQAALLEAMQEYRVTASGKTFDLAAPFFVLATQNPLEQEGTYPLPEAQLDRFMFSIFVDYPSEEEEEQIAKFTTSMIKPLLNKVMQAEQILELQKTVRNLPVSDHVLKYAVRLVRATRPGDKRAPEFISRWISCGSGPRAAQNIIVAAKARAVIAGRLLVTADDVRSVARPVLRHRIFTNFTADSEGMNTDKIVNKLLETVPEPSAADY
jgi:MoxR-like ATPase